MNTEVYKKMIMDLNMPPPMDITTPQEETQQPIYMNVQVPPVDMPEMQWQVGDKFVQGITTLSSSSSITLNLQFSFIC